MTRRVWESLQRDSPNFQKMFAEPCKPQKGYSTITGVILYVQFNSLCIRIFPRKRRTTSDYISKPAPAYSRSDLQHRHSRGMVSATSNQSQRKEQSIFPDSRHVAAIVTIALSSNFFFHHCTLISSLLRYRMRIPCSKAISPRYQRLP